nr:TonB-dependent receptor [uncultured Desulfobacter sp.]
MNCNEIKPKRNIFLGVCLVVALILNTPYAMGAETGDEESQTDVQELEPLTVTGSKRSTRPDLQPDSLTNPYRTEASTEFATEVFTREDIKNFKPKDLNDLIDKAAGIDITYQGRKSPYFIRQRGGGSFTYIIDGAVLPPSVNRILYKFPVASIEELKVVRGATSLTLGPTIPIGASSSGSGINTGFIIIRTRQPEKTEGTLRTSVEKSVGGHPVGYSADLYVGTRMKNEAGTEAYVGVLGSKMDRSSQDTWFDGQESYGGMANAGFSAGKFNLNMMVYQDTGRFEMQRGVLEDGSLDDAKWYYDPLKVRVLSTDGSLKWTSNQVTLFNVFKTDYEQNEHNGYFDSTSVTEKEEYTEETSGFGLRHNARFGGTLVQAGIQMSSSTGYGPNLSKGYNRYDTTVTGFSASVEQSLFNNNLILDLGGRWDEKHIDNSSAARSESLANDDANNDVDMAPAKVVAFGAHWKMTDRVTLDGRYFYGDQGTSGDFDMRLEDDATPHAEKQERIEIGLGVKIVSFFNPTLTWFRVDTENEKSATSDTYETDTGTYYYYTESDTLRQGIELAVQGTICQNTFYKASWTYMLKNESTSDGVTTDEIGLYSPENIFGLTLTHHWNAYRFNLSVKQVDEWTSTRSARSDVTTGGLGGYTRVDANISRDFILRNMLMNVAIFGRNLGDENYSTRYVTGYYPDRGRTLGMEVSFSF